MSIHIFVLCSWAEFTQGEAGAKAVSKWELLTHASGDDSSSRASTADFLGLPRGTQALRGNGPGEGPVKFLLIVDPGSILFSNWEFSFQGVRGQKADSVAQDHLDSMCRSVSPMWLPCTQGHSPLQ